MADYDPDAEEEQRHARKRQRERTESVEDMLGEAGQMLGELDADVAADESNTDAD